MGHVNVRWLMGLLCVLSSVCGSLPSESMRELVVTGLPPRSIDAELRSTEWSEPAQMLFQLESDSGSLFNMQIVGISQTEVPIASIARIQADSFVEPSGIRRTIRLLNSGGEIVALIALNQGAGYRFLPGFTIGPGRTLENGRQPRRMSVILVVKTEPGETIEVPPGSSVAIKGDGVAWRFTCHSATVADTPPGTVPASREPAPLIASESALFSASFTLVREPA